MREPPVQKTPVLSHCISIAVREGGSSEKKKGRLTDKLSDKQTQPDPDRGNKISFVLLRRQHEDREDKLCRQYHFDDHALGDGRAAAEGGADGELALEENAHDGRGANGCDNLRDEEQNPTDPGYGAN